MNNKTTPKDFFLHLGATIALYTAVGALVNLAFTIIDYLNPDVLAGSFYAGSVAWPVSLLIVTVPILYTLEWFIKRDYVTMPEKKDIWIRKWRIFLTLFLAVIFIGGDIVALLNTYFSGEITARFAYKILAVVLIAGTVGKYYFYSMYDTMRWARMSTRLHTWFGLLLVVAAIVGGFVITGSPTKQRNLRLDLQRISDLSSIQWQVISYWQRTSKLPSAISELKDDISGITIPSDPETKNAYEYNVKSGKSFELCATFAAEVTDMSGRGAYGRGGYVSTVAYPYEAGVDGNDAWTHGVGKVCFTRTIDPTRYPPAPKPLPVSTE